MTMGTEDEGPGRRTRDHERAGLNASQQSSVLSAFRHVSELLAGIERLSEDGRHAFSATVPDLATHESRALRMLAGQMRDRMLDALQLLGIPPPAPRVSSRWSALTALRFADVAISQLSSGALGGYGTLDRETEARLVSLGAELSTLLASGAAALSSDDEAELEDALRSIDGPAADVLRELHDVIQSNGLFNLRSEFLAVAERAGAPLAEVGVFGRVSSGKTSLINALVGSSVLPVGATPTTAVPLRIQRGATRVDVHFNDGRAQSVSLEEITAFATEEGNPRNRRAVRGIEVFVPEAPAGIRLLDTPGVSAAPTPGSVSTYAWVARCDVGLLLIPAASAIDAEDRALLNALRAAGVDVHVLLSKVDLLSSDQERDRAFAYIHAELAALLPAPDGGVKAVSSAPGSELLIRELRDNVILPLLEERRATSSVRLKRRLHHLVARAEAATRGRPTPLESKLERREVLERTARSVREVTDALPERGPHITRRAAAQVSEAWRRREPATDAVRDEVAGELARALATVRETTLAALGRLDVDPELAGVGLPPLPDISILSLPDLSPPALLARPLLPAIAARRLANLERPLASFLGTYARGLQRWTETALERAATLSPESHSDTALGDGSLERLHRLVDAIPDRGWSG